MSLNYWKYFTFHPQILPKVYFLSPKLLKNSFFNPIFVSKLIKKLFTKYKDKKKNFLKFRNSKKNLLVKFRYKIFLLYFFTLYKKKILFYNIADLGFTEDVIVVCICLDGLWANQWAGFYYFWVPCIIFCITFSDFF